EIAPRSDIGSGSPARSQNRRYLFLQQWALPGGSIPVSRRAAQASATDPSNRSGWRRVPVSNPRATESDRRAISPTSFPLIPQAADAAWQEFPPVVAGLNAD